MSQFSFVVEDGTGIEGSNSYVDLDFIFEYAEFYNYPEIQDLDEELLERLAIKASRWVDKQLTWMSVPLVKGQGLEFPRVPFESRTGADVEGIPDLIKEATVIGIITQNNGEDLYKAVKSLKSETYGNSSETYFGAYEVDGQSSLIKEVLSDLRQYGAGKKGFKQIPIIKG